MATFYISNDECTQKYSITANINELANFAVHFAYLNNTYNIETNLPMDILKKVQNDVYSLEKNIYSMNRIEIKEN